MGFRRDIRSWMMGRGYAVPLFLVRPHDRHFQRVVNSVRHGMVIVDIGAHKGSVAAAFAARGATVHAFEANPDIYPTLEAAGKSDPRIRPHHCGVLDHNGEMTLYLHEAYPDNPSKFSESSSFVADKPNLSVEHSHVVPVRDVADLLRSIGSPIDIVKIDIEGAEYRVLQRIIDTGLIELIGQVYVETHHDRIPSLLPEYEAVKAKIASLGLAAKIDLTWV